MLSQDGFGVELDAFDRQFFVTQAHDQPVGRFGRDFEHVGQRFAVDNEGMVATRVELALDSGEQRSSVVLHCHRLAVHRLGPADYVSAEMLPDCLMAEANAEDRHTLCEPFDHRKRNPGGIGCSGTGRDEYFFRLQIGFDFIDGNFVIADDLHIGTQLAQVLDEVVGEGIVIIYDQQHRAAKTDNGERSIYLLIGVNKTIIFELTAGGRMKLTKLLSALTMLAIFSQLGIAQALTDKKPTDDPEALKKEAVAFLRETMADVNNLRTLENRISFSAELAGLMWFHDEREARSLYVMAFGNFRELLMQYDQQMNALGEPSEEQEPVGRRTMFGEVGERGQLYRRFQTAMQVRQQISMSLAEHDAELAFQFYFDSTNAVTNSEFRKQLDGRDEYFENQLLAEIAKTNVSKAVQFAKKSVEKGLNYQHIDILRKIYAKDPEKGAELAVTMLAKAKTNLDSDQFWVINSFLGAASDSFEASQKEGGKKPMLTQSELRELADTFGQAILDDKSENSNGLGYVGAIEKYSPSRALQIKAKFKAASGTRDPNRYTIRNGVASAPPPDYMGPVITKGSGSANAVAGKQERERLEREKAEKELRENVGKLTNKQLPKEERQTIVAQARKIVMSTPGKDKKIVGLSALAATVAKAGDKELAAEIMKEAQALVNPQPKNYQDFLLTWMLAAGFAEAEPEKAFPLLEDAIMRANDTLTAFIKVGEFIDVAGEMIDDGEVQVGAFGGQMVRGLTSELGMAEATLRTLAKADFKKTRDLTSRFDRSEVRILAKMMILRAVLGEGKTKKAETEVIVSIEK